MKEEEILDKFLSQISQSNFSGISIFDLINFGITISLTQGQTEYYIQRLVEDQYVFKNKENRYQENKPKTHSFKGYQERLRLESTWMYKINHSLIKWNPIWTICISIIALLISFFSIVYSGNSSIENDVKELKVTQKRQDKFLDSLITVLKKDTSSSVYKTTPKLHQSDSN